MFTGRRVSGVTGRGRIASATVPSVTRFPRFTRVGGTNMIFSRSPWPSSHEGVAQRPASASEVAKSGTFARTVARTDDPGRWGKEKADQLSTTTEWAGMCTRPALRQISPQAAARLVRVSSTTTGRGPGQMITVRGPCTIRNQSSP